MTKAVFQKLFPEMALGGYPRHSHKVVFFNRVHAVLGRDHTVLDFGAGRGASNVAPNAYETSLTTLRNRCHRVIGVDTDPVVLENPTIDEAHVIGDDGKLPLPDESIDLIVSWAVFEHIVEPRQATDELKRVLKPGGWICAFTPNKFGDVAIAASLVPNALHAAILRRMGMIGQSSARQDKDVFPTYYRLNTARAIKSHFPPDEFDHHSYRTLGPPGYNGGSVLIARLMRLYDAVTPEFLSRMWHIFIRKKR